VEIDLNVLAAIMTIIGYSINDTIIIYDRLRENLRSGEKLPFDALINKSVNQTLSRTVLTGGTTLLATAALYVFGGGVIHDFALTMLIGIIVGTASSIYISSAVLLILGDTEFYRNQLERQQKKYERPGEHGVV
ncbi:MAG: MMPL family transporter, partial [Desulfovibrio sp.]|jgi:preprotein translocase subunit SecF|nr:MMPL family transporter [Desulfovibrio sp.]